MPRGFGSAFSGEAALPAQVKDRCCCEGWPSTVHSGRSHGHGRRGRARANVELAVDALQAMFDGGGRQAENAGNLRIALAVGEPGQHLGLARAEPEGDNVRGPDAKLALAQQQERPTAVAQDLNREAPAVAFDDEWPQRRDGSVNVSPWRRNQPSIGAGSALRSLQRKCEVSRSRARALIWRMRLPGPSRMAARPLASRP